MNEDYGTEIFLVMSNRKGNNFPDIVKSDETIYFMERDAQKVLEQKVKEIGPYYGVYRAIIKVKERVT